jgi:hypothetical protein
VIEGVLAAVNRWEAAHAPADRRPALGGAWVPFAAVGDEVRLTFQCGCQLVMHRGDDPIRQWGPCRHGTWVRAAGR